MSRKLRIDFVAPPFAGHLFPALQLARGLQQRSEHSVRVLSTESAKPAVIASELEFVEILSGRDQSIWEIANTAHRVGSNPLRLWKQLMRNLALMGELKEQVQSEWKRNRPDLVLVDFVVPIAGLTALDMNIPWWTGMPSPCALETSTGTPAYLGGWVPRDDWLGRGRDWIGRQGVRLFKRATYRLFSRPFRKLGIVSLYRKDGTEIVYSPQRILGYGLQEFEFARNWPDVFEFIGPLPLPPPFPAAVSPNFSAGRKTILISLGTHLNWAKRDALEIFRSVAQLMPSVDFHFSSGRPGEHASRSCENLHIFDFIPYTEILENYSAVVHHAGTGILYACLQAGRPALVSPQDYDQFDHAARIVAHQLGRRLSRNPKQIVSDLRSLLGDTSISTQLHQFQTFCRQSNPVQRTLELIESDLVSIK